MQERYGEWLKKQRRALGLTQEELAVRAGLDRTYINKIERGTVVEPQEEVRSKIEKVFGFYPSVSPEFINQNRVPGPSGDDPDLRSKMAHLVRDMGKNPSRYEVTPKIGDVDDATLGEFTRRFLSSLTKGQRELLRFYIETTVAELDAIDPPTETPEPKGEEASGD